MAYHRRAELQKAIQDHLLSNGPKDWDVLQRRFQDCPSRTFFRYVKQTKDVPPLPEHVAVAMQRVKQVAGGESVLREEDGLLPVPTVPIGFLTQEGPQALRKLDIIKSIQSINDDIDMLRKHAMADGKVVDPKVLADSAKLRITTNQLYISAIDLIWHQSRQAAFFNQVLEVVRQESPECAKRIVQGLRKLNQVVPL